MTQRSVTAFLIILGVLVIALFGGVVYYKKAYEESFFSYHGFDFKKATHGYEIAIYLNNQPTPRTISLRSDPRTLEDIPVDKTILSLKDKKTIFATINPYDNLTGATTIAVLEIDKILDNSFLYDIPVNATFTEPYGKNGLDVKTCADARDDTAVLWFKLEDATKVYLQDGCFIVAGVEENDLIRAADRIVYTLLGIMKA